MIYNTLYMRTRVLETLELLIAQVILQEKHRVEFRSWELAFDIVWSSFAV